MSARTKRGLVLFWSALFVFSILLQYATFAAPAGVTAISNTTPFELDGNATDDGAGDDWANVFGNTDGANLSMFITDGFNAGDDIFTGGNSKDIDNSSSWLWKYGSVQDKNDIENAFAAQYTVGTDSVVTFGLDRYQTSGDASAGFWFFKNPISAPGPGTPPGSSFSAAHTNGDILVVLNFTNGGAVAAAEVFEWQNGLVSIDSGVKCGPGNTDNVCAISNEVEVDSPWPYTPKSGTANKFPANALLEGGINLTELGFGGECFSSFLAETRSSQETTATLSDFALGSFDTCGSVTIVKDAVPNDAQDFTFGGGFGAFSLDDDANATLSNTKVVNKVNPGTYLVTETNIPAGWDLSSIVCDDGQSSTPSTTDVGTATATIKVDPLEDVTCTFTNTKRGKIIIEKQTNPDGATGSFGFTGEIVASLSDNGTAEKGNLVPGQYTVTESDPIPGFDLGAIVCDDANSTGNVGTRTATFNLEAGETVKCTFTNVKRGTITIIKNAIPDDDQDFTYTTVGGGLSGFVLDDNGSNGDGTSNTKMFATIVPGAYSVTELATTGWDLSDLQCNGTAGSTGTPSGATANINLTAGGSVTCTFSNTKRGHILIDKVTNPSGDPASFEFDPSYGPNFFLTDAAAPNDSGALVPGTYSVAELALAGWDLTGTSCSDQSPVTAISLQPGETVTCTFTNTKRGTIIVEKQTSPNGAAGNFTFTGDAAGVISDNGAITVVDLVPGTYTSTESDPTPGFDLGAIVCDDGASTTPSTWDVGARTATFELDPGETVRCTFTNVQRGTITIIKNAVPNDDQDFSFGTAGAGLSGFSLDDDNDNTLSDTTTFQNVVGGSYSVTEAAVAGWDLTGLICNGAGGSSGAQDGTNPAKANITMTAGGSVTCTFTNSKPSIQIVKTAGTAVDGAVLVTQPGNVTYSYKVTNTGPVTLTGVTVRDDNGSPANLADDFDAVCPKTTLAAGEEMTCTATVAVSSSRTNVAAASGTSEQGTEVADSDDAVVRIPGTGIDKSHNDVDGIVGHGQEVTFTILVEVVQGPITNAVVTDTLPVGQTYVAASQQSNPAATSFIVSANGRTLTWTYASLPSGDPAATITYKVTIDGNAPTGTQTNVAQICVSELTACKTDDSTVKVPLLTILKSFVGNTGGTTLGGDPEAKNGDVLTYTLAYDLTNGPVTNGVITDTLPVGLAYVAGTATNNAEFTFDSFNAATRTLTWKAPTVTADGTVTYQAVVLAGADELPQPLVNVAIIDSNETGKDDDDAKVFVEPPPLAATGTPTVTTPPTDAINGQSGQSDPGFGLMLTLLALAGLVLGLGFVIPVPARVRRSDRRG